MLLHGAARPRPRPREALLRLPPPPARPIDEATELVVRRFARSRPWEGGHSLAWLAWCCGALACIWQTLNPFYLLLVLLTALVVFLSCGRADLLRQTFIIFTGLGLIIFVMQLLFSVVTAGSLGGRTVVATLPQLRLPDLLGGIALGGPVTAEQLAWGALRGLRLWAMLMVLGAFNATVNHYRLLRRVPAFLYQTALVTTVALVLVPATITRLRTIREAQRLRGHRFRSVRDVLPLLAPLIAGGLERSLTLAEAMECRGYGSAARRASPGGSALSAASALLAVLGIFGALYSPALRPAGLALLALGALGLALRMRQLATSSRRTSYTRERWERADLLQLGLALAAPVLLPLLGGSTLSVQILPTFQMPGFAALAGLAVALLAAPAFVRPAQR